MDCNLDFKEHRNWVLKKARDKSAWVLRTFKCRSLDLLRRLWRSLVQSHLDYSCLLWSPVDEVGELKRMESILRSFSKYGCGLRDIPYYQRLKLMKLSSQERRVERYKILYMRKMICGMVPNLGCVVKEDSRQGKCLDLNRCNKGSDRVKNLRDKSLLVEGVRLYNCVPRNIREY